MAESPLAQHLDRRRRLCRAAFQLSPFACHGDHHLEAYNAEEDPLAVWLDRVWLLSSRLMLSLPILYRDVERAVVEAERAARDFGLNTPGARVLDVFDPFDLSSEQDIGRTITLAALFTSLDVEGGRPIWWTSALEERISEIAGQGPSAEKALADDIGDRFGIGFPLREGDLAHAILGVVGKGAKSDRAV